MQITHHFIMCDLLSKNLASQKESIAVCGDTLYNESLNQVDINDQHQNMHEFPQMFAQTAASAPCS